MKKRYYKKCFVIGLIAMFILVSFPTSNAETFRFSNGIVIVVGRCNIVESTGFWVFGLTGIYQRDVNIYANNQEGETVHLIVISPEIGFFFSKEKISIHMTDTNGFIFWGEKALLLNNNPQRVVTFCKANDIIVTI